MTTIKLGISPCPNDTFIFHGFIHGLTDFPHAVETVLADVEELNGKAIAAKDAASPFDVVKVSVAALPAMLDEYVILRSGGALGRGVGPVLVARPPLSLADMNGRSVAIPGEKTTGNLLMGLALREVGASVQRVPMIYSDVMDAVTSGLCDTGLLIHEGRFTYHESGLELVADLGAWWVAHRGLPIPLGCILVRRALGENIIRSVGEAIRQSLKLARRDIEPTREYIRAHAQEMDDSVIREHIKTFVTDASMDIGKEGEEAIRTLLKEASVVTGIPLTDKSLFVE